MSALTLDIGYRLTPLPEAEWSDQLTLAQELTWLLIQRLGSRNKGTVPETMVSNLLGLKDPRPLRSRIKHLIEKGALRSERVA
jgi:hypothetical protein